MACERSIFIQRTRNQNGGFAGRLKLKSRGLHPDKSSCCCLSVTLRQSLSLLLTFKHLSYNAVKQGHKLIASSHCQHRVLFRLALD
jgi:hypothetical protein